MINYNVILKKNDKMDKILIECEICGSWAYLDQKPDNNICPICLTIGSLFIQEKPTIEQQLKEN